MLFFFKPTVLRRDSVRRRDHLFGFKKLLAFPCCPGFVWNRFPSQSAGCQVWNFFGNRNVLYFYHNTYVSNFSNFSSWTILWISIVFKKLRVDADNKVVTTNVNVETRRKMEKFIAAPWSVINRTDSKDRRGYYSQNATGFRSQKAPLITIHYWLIILLMAS